MFYTADASVFHVGNNKLQVSFEQVKGEDIKVLAFRIEKERLMPPLKPVISAQKKVGATNFIVAPTFVPEVLFELTRYFHRGILSPMRQKLGN